MGALPVIELSDEEIMFYATVGAQRAAKCMAKRRAPAEGVGHRQDWQVTIEGVLGEAALAKHYNLFVTSMGGWGAMDVGGRYEVRTSYNHDQPMRIKPEDKDHLPYFYLTGVNGKYVIRGWIRGKDGKQDQWFYEYKRQGHPAYWVPHAQLKHPDEVPDIISPPVNPPQTKDASLGF